MRFDDGVGSPEGGSLDTLSPPLEYSSALKEMEVQVNGESSTPMQPLLCRLNSSQLSPRTRMEHEKRLRREIANSNERRRMQSINTGFQNLKSLLPKRDGEKMSKASILQQSVQFIRRLQAEKMQLLQQNLAYKQILEVSGTLPPSSNSSPAVERMKTPGVSIQPSSQELHKPRTPIHTVSGITGVSASPSSGISSSPLSNSSASPFCTLGQTTTDVVKSENVSTSPAIIAPPKKRRRFIDSELSDEGVYTGSDSEVQHGKMQSTNDQISAASQEDPMPKHSQGQSLNTGDQNLRTETAESQPIDSAQILSENAESDGSSQVSGIWELKKEMLELKLALERERNSRVALEDHLFTSERTKVERHVNPGALTHRSDLTSVLSLPSQRGGNNLFPGHTSVSQLYSPQPRLGGLPLPIVGSSASATPVISSILPLTPPALKGQHEANTKQNLDVIVEAINHLEGRRLEGNQQLLVQSDSSHKDAMVNPGPRLGGGPGATKAFNPVDRVTLLDQRLLLEQHAAFLAAANYRNQQTQRLVQQSLVSSSLQQ